MHCNALCYIDLNALVDMGTCARYRYMNECDLGIMYGIHWLQLPLSWVSLHCWEEMIWAFWYSWGCLCGISHSEHCTLSLFSLLMKVTCHLQVYFTVYGHLKEILHSHGMCHGMLCTPLLMFSVQFVCFFVLLLLEMFGMQLNCFYLFLSKDWFNHFVGDICSGQQRSALYWCKYDCCFRSWSCNSHCNQSIVGC